MSGYYNGYRRRGYGRGYGGRSYGGYRGRGYNNNGGYRNRKKRTGAKMGVNENSGRPYITGWNVSRRYGMRKFIANPTDLMATTKNGKERQQWVCNVEMDGGMTKRTVTGFYDESSKKLYMPDLNMVASINAPNGGYWGQIKSRR
ncbi:MAG: hypothetical protein MI974_19040 [Chitinophagales bacterium]|nr:hypothetical protein [Chitinophagales bacterium]